MRTGKGLLHIEENHTISGACRTNNGLHRCHVLWASERDHGGIRILPVSFGWGASSRQAGHALPWLRHCSEVVLCLLQAWRLCELDAFLLGSGIRASLMGYLKV